MTFYYFSQKHVVKSDNYTGIEVGMEKYEEKKNEKLEMPQLVLPS